MIDITKTQLKIVQEILNKIIPDRQVKAFGSRVTGKAKEFSDLDLAVFGKSPLDALILGDLKEAFSKSNLPFMVDVVDVNRISEEFKTLIEKNNMLLSS